MTETIYIVIGLNGLLAIGVLLLARQLWRWRSRLESLTTSLEAIELIPGETSYALTLRRVQLVEARLGVARFQLRSRQLQHQLKQLLRLLWLLRLVLRSSSGMYWRPSRRSGRLLRQKSR